MEGPGNTPLNEMARLTHWVENKGEYTNVISGRVIKKEDWAKRNTSFVKLTRADGYSKTEDFYRTNTGSLTAQSGAMSLNNPATQATGSTGPTVSGSSTTRAPSPPSTHPTSLHGQPPAGQASPQNPTSTPAPSRTQNPTPNAPKLSRNITPPPPGARSQQTSPAGPSRSTDTPSAPRPVTATLNGSKYPVSSRDGRPVSITVGKKDVSAVTRSASGQGYVVEDKGKKVPITLSQ
jgi:hypothetical protein